MLQQQANQWIEMQHILTEIKSTHELVMAKNERISKLLSENNQEMQRMSILLEEKEQALLLIQEKMAPEMFHQKII